jgi:hypothetical protein
MLAAACSYWIFNLSYLQFLLQIRDASDRQLGKMGVLEGSGGGKSERESEELLNFTFRGRSHDVQPRWRCPTFLHCCELLSWAPANIQAAVT